MFIIANKCVEHKYCEHLLAHKMQTPDTLILKWHSGSLNAYFLVFVLPKRHVPVLCRILHSVHVNKNAEMNVTI